jgi:sugar lactone lactonase YvrE
LVDEVAGRAVRFANDLTMGTDGRIWFTDSSARHHSGSLGDSPSYLLPDLVEGRPTGRLLVHDPATGRTTQVLDGLHFPNGVAFTPDGDTLWIAESTRYRLLAYDLTAGTTRVVADALPGVPDGITAAGGVMLVALYDRTQALDRLVLPTALGRELMGRLPMSLFVNEDDPLGGGVLELGFDGAVRRWHTGIVPAPTNVVPHDGRWLFGALLGQPIRVMTI